MKKNFLLSIALFLCCTSSYSYAGFFSFLNPIWQTPVSLFCGARKFIRHRIPIVTKTELSKTEKRTKESISQNVNDFRDKIIHERIDPLHRQVEDQKDFISKLKEDFGRIQAEQQARHGKSRVQLEQLNLQIQRIQAQLAQVIALNKQTRCSLEQEKAKAIQEFGELSKEIKSSTENITGQFKQLEMQVNDSAIKFSGEIDKMEQRRIREHEEFMSCLPRGALARATQNKPKAMFGEKVQFGGSVSTQPSLVETLD